MQQLVSHKHLKQRSMVRSTQWGEDTGIDRSMVRSTQWGEDTGIDKSDENVEELDGKNSQLLHIIGSD
jgi:hypothetical protein